MNYSVIFRVLAILVWVYMLTLIPPMVLAVVWGDGMSGAFELSLGIMLGLGAVFYIASRAMKSAYPASAREGFAILVLCWLIVSIISALPLAFAPVAGTEGVFSTVPWVNAWFEAVSGVTTTGATIFADLSVLPASILYYRQQMQWFGGIGLVVIGIAILPLLRMGSTHMYRMDACSVVDQTRERLRVSETAKRLCVIYLLLSVICAASYALAGMSVLDAIQHSFSTVSIGGFSPHNASIAHFDNRAIEAITMAFMFIASINFMLHFQFLAKPQRALRAYLQDDELRLYAHWLCLIVCIAIVALWWHGDTLADAIRYGAFQALSIATTTGYGLTEWQAWPQGLALLIFLTAFVGGCSGSAAGGLKIVRYAIILRQAYREILLKIHPQAVMPLRWNARLIPTHVADNVCGFFTLYFITFGALFIALLFAGLSVETAFATLAACLNNLGPAMGDAALHYGDLPSAGKLILTIAMLLGRLELMAFLVLLTPAYWRY